MKKVIMIILVVTLVLGNSIFSVNASEVINVKDNYSNIAAKAIDFLGDYVNNPKLGTPVELYGLNDNIVAVFYELKNGGYIIINTNDFSVPEFSPTSSNKYYSANSKNKYYYNGPGAYFIKNGNVIKDLKHNENLGTAQELCKEVTKTGKYIYGDVKNSVSATNQNISTDQAVQRSVTTTVERRVPGTVPNYSYNPDGICGSTACAMVLRYLDIYFPDDYVPSNLESSTGVALIQYLVPYMNDPGTNPANLFGGLQDYLDDRNIDDFANWDVSGIGLIMNYISASRPFVLGLHNHPTYSEHWVTGYGYSHGTTDYAIVNDGWGNTNIYINLSYTDYTVYTED